MNQRRLPTAGTDLSGEASGAWERIHRAAQMIAARTKLFNF
jgi:hypothetical protein